MGGYLLLLNKFTVSSRDPLLGSCAIAPCVVLQVLSAVGIDSGSQLSQCSMTSSESQQVEVEIHGSAGQTGFHTLCLELLGEGEIEGLAMAIPLLSLSFFSSLGTLKRSLSQQCEVKITLYQVCSSTLLCYTVAGNWLRRLD